MVEAKEMGDMEISVYRHPNTEIRSFLTPLPVCPPLVEAFKAPYNAGDTAALALLGTVGTQIVKDIMALSGILEIRIKPKEIRILKAPEATWEALEGPILKILSSALKRKQLRRIK